MANATAKVPTRPSNVMDNRIRRPVPVPGAKTTWFPGALVCVDTATGSVVKGASGVGLSFDGVIANGFHHDAIPGDPTTYTSGPTDPNPLPYLEIERAPRFRCATSVDVTAATDLHKPVYLVDDQTVTKTAPANPVKCGTILFVHGPRDVTVQATYPS